MNLRDEVLKWVEKHGPTKASRMLISPTRGEHLTRNAVQKWQSGAANPPLWVAQFVLDHVEYELQSFDGNLPWEGERLRICVPCTRGIGAKTAKTLQFLSNLHKGKVGLDVEENTLVDIARNRLAHRFMQSEAEWLLFLDSDMVPPCGSYGQMKAWGMEVPTKFGAFDIITRLITREKPLISGLYFDRHGNGKGMYHEAINDEKEAAWARNGPYDTVKPVKATGAGCLLINRTVFEAIKHTCGDDIAPKVNGIYRYFEPLPGVGEDFSFCARARTAGHATYLDAGCLVGHEGSFVYWNKKHK